MENLLSEMAEVLCTVYTPSHKRLYALKRMGVVGIRLYHKDRKKVLDGDDKKKIKSLLAELMTLDVDPSNQTYFYYRQVLYRDMYEILNGA